MVKSQRQATNKCVHPPSPSRELVICHIYTVVAHYLEQCRHRVPDQRTAQTTAVNARNLFLSEGVSLAWAHPQRTQGTACTMLARWPISKHGTPLQASNQRTRYIIRYTTACFPIIGREQKNTIPGMYAILCTCVINRSLHISPKIVLSCATTTNICTSPPWLVGTLSWSGPVPQWWQSTCSILRDLCPLRTTRYPKCTD